jgi:transposase
MLEQVGSLTERIREYERQLETVSEEHYPETELLRRVEEIGPLTALTFVLTLERVMNLDEDRIGMRIPRSAWLLRDLRFLHS